MEDRDFKSKIKEIAVMHFDRDGYYGTTIRKIAAEAGCSVPMIYYYYKSKKELFHEIIKKDYFDILNKQAKMLQLDNLIQFYTDFAYGLNSLSDYDRKVYRLGIKVYLSFDGDEELKAIMDEWEQSIALRHARIILPHLKSQEEGLAVVRTLIHLLENLIESIIVKNRVVSKEEIQEEISLILASKI